MFCRASIGLTISSLLVVHALEAGNLLLKNYSTQDGLPDSRVAPILQDRKGYLWFGTQAGLTRYDGKEFVNFTGAKEIPGIFGRDIIEDHTGAIWFAYTGFDQGGLLRLWNGNRTEFGPSSGLMSNNPGSVAEDSHHDIWVGSGSGLDRIHFTDSGRAQWTVEHYPEYKVQALFVDSKGTLWIGGASGSLHSYTVGKFKLISDRLYPAIRGQAVYESRDGSMWFGGIFGILVIDQHGQRRYTTSDGLPSRGVWAFCEDHAGNFWVGTADGLYRRTYENGRVMFEKEHSFGDAIVYDICLDAEGNVWFASDPGVRKLLASDLIIDFPGKEILSTPGFGPIVQHFDGTIYFGSRNLGVFTLRGSTLRHGQAMRPYTTYTILSIFPETPDRTWYGLKRGGLILQEGTRSLQFDEEPIRSAEPSSVHSIVRTDRSHILVGTARGLQRAESGKLIPMRHAEIDGLVIFDILRFGTNQDEYWLATNNGVRIVEIRDTEIHRVQPVEEPALRGTIVYEIFVDAQRQLWFGTDGKGLISHHGAAYRQYTREDGLVGDRVYALGQDSLGQLWIGTSSGLSCFDGQSFRNFRYENGFGEIGLHGLLTDREGYLWVSSFPGITKIRPQRFLKSNRPPPIYISDMQVDTLHFTGNTEIELDPNPAVVTFRYAGLSFTDETNVRYRYKLDGFDHDWSPPVTYREVRYTHLGSGSYTFRVIARSADGVWSDRPAVVPFTILPPVWARWWFIGGTGVVIVLSAYGIYRYRLAKALELERTRSRIAMDLHDDIGASLTRISMMTEVAQRVAGNPPRELEIYLGKIGETSRELIDALGDIVWSVDPRHDTLQDVIRRLVHFGEELCEARGLTFDTMIAPDLDRMPISLEHRRDLYLLFKEAIANAVRHSGANRLQFTIRRTESTITIAVEDNGRGFNPASAGDGRGLKSMNERANRLAMQMMTVSQPGQGTRVELLMKTV